MSDKSKSFEDIHKQACQSGMDTYKDPTTGYQVFTAVFHEKRGHCCDSGCRHCPWKKDRQKATEDSSD